MKPREIVAGLAIAAWAGTAAADITVRLKPVPMGAMKKIGSYSPQSIILGPDKPASLRATPQGATAPLYGVLPIHGDGRTYHVLLSEPPDGAARLWVDSNGNGDLTDDPPAEWDPKPKSIPGGLTFRQYSGGATILLPLGSTEPQPVRLGMYRFDRNDPTRERLKDQLLYFRDYAMEGEVAIDGRTYRAILSDERARGDFHGESSTTGDGEASGVFLFLDLNGNDTFEPRRERFDVRSVLQIDGSAYEIRDLSPTGETFRLVKSDRVAPAARQPADHRVGAKCTSFEATTLDGATVKFPDDYKGKLVLLDFWATWCGPCIGEIPSLVAAYEKYRGQGFEILGISLDRAGQSDNLRAFLSKKGMSWPQVYDGKGWQAEIAQLYRVRGIPAAFLVDGDTGEILATSQTLRREALEKTVAAQLARKSPAGPGSDDKPADSP